MIAIKKIRRRYHPAILLGVVFLLQETARGQAPSLSYTTPQTYVAGTTIAPLSPTVSGSTAANGQTVIVAGTGSAVEQDGTDTGAGFNQPLAMVIDKQGNVFIADASGHVIRKMTQAGVVTTVAGTAGSAGFVDGNGSSARFNHPVGLAIDGSGNIYVADEDNQCIRKINPSTGYTVTTVAGNGTAGYINSTSPLSAEFNLPCGVAVDASGNIYVGDYNNNCIREIAVSGSVTTYAGSTTGVSGSTDAVTTSARFNHPFGLVFDSGGYLWVCDRLNETIRRISSTGSVVTVGGSAGLTGSTDGVGANARFYSPTEITTDGANLYISDEANHKIRKLSQPSVVSTLAGTGVPTPVTSGVGSASTFNDPFGIGCDPLSGVLYVGDLNNYIKTVACSNFSISPDLPAGLIFNSSSGIISGTPAAQQPSTAYQAKVYNSAGYGGANLSIIINPAGSLNFGNNNFIVTYRPRVSNITTNAQVYTGSGDKTQVETSVEYYDGIGRLLQTVQAMASPNGYDIVQPVAYDQYGREASTYLSYKAVTNDASFKNDALVAGQGIFYYYNPTGSGTSGTQQTSGGVVTNPYPLSVTNFEPSPLNRPAEQGGEGAPWQPVAGSISGQTVKISYLNNDASAPGTLSGYGVRLYNVNVTGGNASLLNGGTYTAGELAVTVTANENWTGGKMNTTEEYKDKEGHVILQRTFNHNGASGLDEVLSTYSVYDDFGNLCFVLPPNAGGDAGLTSAVNQSTLDNLCYQYNHDSRNRVTGKKLPGNAWEYTVYNNTDQPVATQDGNQRLNNQWLFSKYDGQGRVVWMGIWNNGNIAISQVNLQSTLNSFTGTLWEIPAGPTGNGYPNTAWPTTNITTTLALNYYDTYSNIPALPAAYVPSAYNTNVHGQLLASLVNELGSSDMLWTVHYFDAWGREVQSYKQHYLGGVLNTANYDAITTTYDFTNAPTTITRKHYAVISNTPVLAATVFNRYIYDQKGRKRRTWEQITPYGASAGPMTVIAQLNYNETGQLWSKQLHSTDSVNYLQTITYAYNERGWLQSSTSPLFQEQLQYNTGTIAGITITPQFNGNIASSSWGTAASPNTSYNTYTYDYMNRLINSSSNTPNYEGNISYDLNGNITGLTRAGGSNSGTFGYAYSGNQLKTVTNGSGTIRSYGSYDPNGNAPSDGLSNTINYNLVNLPATIPGKGLTYTYDASGNKQRKVSTANGTTDYINGIQYFNGNILFIQTDEGRVLNSGSGHYEYSLTDHLGNERASFDTYANTVSPTQQDDYYPFGLEISKGTTVSPKNDYLYNRKELQDELNQYDYGARFYDPAIARWSSTDPLAEKDFQWSSYNYGENNPVRKIDDGGLSAEDGLQDGFDDGFQEGFPNGGLPPVLASTVINDQGTVIAHYDDGDPRVYKYMRGGPVAGYEDPNKTYRPGDHYTYFNKPTEEQLKAANPYAPNMLDYLNDHVGSVFGIGGTMYGVQELIVARNFNELVAKTAARLGVSFEDAARALSAVKSYFNKGGKLCFWLAASVSALDMIQNIHGHQYGKAAKNGTDIIFGAIGVYGGPVGFAVSTVYFVIDQTIGWDNVGKEMADPAWQKMYRQIRMENPGGY